MFPQSGVSAPSPGRTDLSGGDSIVRVDIRQFPWIKRLATDYAFDYPRLAEFFAGDPAQPAAWREAIGRTQRQARDRQAIAEILHAQQQRRGAPAEAMAAAAELRNPDTVAIVTGQQAGLFGGPLYTLLKALTALQLADRVRDEYGVPAVAVFWIEAEDHDWNEVRSSGVLDVDLQLRQIALPEPDGGPQRPVARVQLDQTITRAIDDLVSTLQPTEFSPDLIDRVKGAYAMGTGMADAFGVLLESVLGPRGLVVYDASDPAAKPLVSAVFARELQRAGETSRLAVDTGRALQGRGYHAQVTASADSVALFHLDGGREPIRRSGDGFAIGDRMVRQADLLAEVEQSPERFSPNVLLRPIVQDSLFPTACYVAGPNELGYLAQLGRVYHAFGVPMPLMYQRATATVLDSNAMRFLTRNRFPFDALRAQDEAALNELLEAQLPPTLESSLRDAEQAVADGLTRLANEVAALDPTLEGATRSTLGRMQDDLKKLHGKIIQAAKRKNETLRRQYHHAQALAFPGGQPQEREVAFIYFLNRYGPSLVERLSEELTLEMGTHWVVTI